MEKTALLEIKCDTTRLLAEGMLIELVCDGKPRGTVLRVERITGRNKAEFSVVGCRGGRVLKALSWIGLIVLWSLALFTWWFLAFRMTEFLPEDSPVVLPGQVLLWSNEAGEWGVFELDSITPEDLAKEAIRNDSTVD